MAAASLQVKRVYDDPTPSDGHRVLVDRLWPRGLTRADAALDAWLKDAAPSPDLRRAFNHEPDRFAEFRRAYRAELRANPDALARLLERLAAGGTVTLLYAAKDPEHNHANVLAEFLRAEAGIDG
jgi:uncharacterized protein YeaO (DUF488 family)